MDQIPRSSARSAGPKCHGLTISHALHTGTRLQKIAPAAPDIRATRQTAMYARDRPRAIRFFRYALRSNPTWQVKRSKSGGLGLREQPADRHGFGDTPDGEN